MPDEKPAPAKNDALTKLAAKLQGLEKAADIVKALEKAGPPAEVLAALADRGVLRLEAGVGVLRVLSNWAHHLPAETVIRWLEDLPGVGSDAFFGTLPGLAWPVRNIVRSSYGTAPAPWNLALERLTGLKRDAVLLARGAAGEAVPEIDRARMLEALVPYAFSGECDDPTEIAAALGVTGEAWGLRTQPLLVKHPEVDPWLFPDGVAVSPFALVEKMVLHARPCAWNTETRTMRLLRLRKDDASTLVELARKLRADPRTDDVHERDQLLEAIGALALERADEADTDAPAGTEDLLDGSHFEARWRNERIVAFASALPQARLLALLERQLSDFTYSLPSPDKAKSAGHLFAGLLRVARDEALSRRWIERTCEALVKSTEVQKREGLSLGQAGPSVLPLVLEALAAWPSEKEGARAVHVGLRAAVLVIAGELAVTGEPIAPTLDALLCGDETVRGSEEMLASAELLAPVLAKLPPERGERVVRSWLALESAWVHKQLVKAVPDHLRSLVVEEGPTERIARLAKESALPCNQRIYALLPVPWNPDHDDDDIAAIAGVINWANAKPRGLAKDRLPTRDGKPMKHVITFDLEAMPELRERLDAPAARAVALFVSAKRQNDSGEPHNDDMVYVPLSEQEALAGFSGSDGRAFTVTAVDVPRAVFETEVTPELEDLRRAVYALPGRALGAAALIQEVDDEALTGLSDDFVMQLSQGLVEMNLGDEGSLYLYRTTAFWQSH